MSKRHPDESYEAYRERRKQEQADLAAKARGTLVHCSSQIVDTNAGLRKIRALGTYRKGKGTAHA